MTEQLRKKRVYLAASYGRREEIKGYAERVKALGFDVSASWLDGPAQDESLLDTETKGEIAIQIAGDIAGSDAMLCFTEAERGAPRGGRHVEMGIALANELHVSVIGPRENIFCNLPCVYHAPDFDAFEARVLKAREDSPKVVEDVPVTPPDNIIQFPAVGVYAPQAETAEGVNA